VTASMPSVPPFEHQCDRTWTARRTATHKTVWTEAGGRPWLEFDLAADPFEMHPL
jgi:hypothetical protein